MIVAKNAKTIISDTEINKFLDVMNESTASTDFSAFLHDGNYDAFHQLVATIPIETDTRH